MKKVQKKPNIILLLVCIIAVLSVAVFLFFSIPTRVICKYDEDGTKETVIATFKGSKLKFIEADMVITFESSSETAQGMELQEPFIEMMKDYGYKVTNKVDGKTIKISYNGRVYDNDENLFEADKDIKDFKEKMKQKSYSCK